MKTTAAKVGVIGQVRTAMGSPAALVVGCLLGGFVPVATYFVSHREAQGWNLATLLVLGGLVYSAKTVFQWGRLAFDCPYKATGFVLLIEGVMVASKTPWLSVLALGYLVAINAVATGCQLALRDAPVAAKKPAKVPSEVPAVEEAPKAPKKPRKARRSVSPSDPFEVTGEFEIVRNTSNG